MNIVLASTNKHKQFEMAGIFAGHTILMPEDLGIRLEHEETGSTFLENAMDKAMHLFHMLNLPVIADDSGLSMPALNGAPGIYSARYGSNDIKKRLTDRDRNEFLLENLEGITDRNGFYVCAMVLVMEEYRFFVAQETLHGRIIDSPRGSGGFGYDPIFFLDDAGKTVAELSPEEKNLISHRGKAGRALKAMLDRM